MTKGEFVRTEYVRDSLRRSIFVEDTYHLSASDIEDIIRSHYEGSGWSIDLQLLSGAWPKLAVVWKKEVLD